MEIDPILKLHSFYREAGGEDASFKDEVGLLRRRSHHVVEIVRHNADLDSMSAFQRAATQLQAPWNRRTYAQVDLVLRTEKPKLAHFTNFIPSISPSAYQACLKHDVPIIQSLHNYRLICSNALLFRDGGICHDCVGKNVHWPSVLHACYRGSRLQSSGLAATMLTAKLMRLWASHVDAFITPSNFAKARYVEAGFEEERVFVNPNFVYPDPGLRKSDPGNGFVYLGRLSGEKGLLTLIDAMDSLPDETLTIVGEGPLRPDLEAHLARRGEQNIRLCGSLPREQAMELVKSSRALVAPSEAYETFGRVAAEAFACGVPVIAARHGALGELVVDGDTGLLFSVNEKENLPERLKWATEHPAEMLQMGLKGRRDFEEKFTEEHSYSALINFYQSVIHMHAVKVRS